MEKERALYIIDKAFDLLTDIMGFDNAVKELKFYDLELTDDEIEYLKRGMAN